MSFLSLIPSGAKMAVVAVLVTVAGLAYWHYSNVVSERNEALAQVGAYQVAHETQQATIMTLETALTSWEDQAAAFQTTLNAMAAAQVEANTQARRLNNVLAKHDLAALSLAKPGLIERRINSGTADVLRMFESSTAGRSDDSR